MLSKSILALVTLLVSSLIVQAVPSTNEPKAPIMISKRQNFNVAGNRNAAPVTTRRGFPAVRPTPINTRRTRTTSTRRATPISTRRATTISTRRATTISTRRATPTSTRRATSTKAATTSTRRASSTSTRRISSTSTARASATKAKTTSTRGATTTKLATTSTLRPTTTRAVSSAVTTRVVPSAVTTSVVPPAISTTSIAPPAVTNTPPANGGGNPATSLTLDPSVIAQGFFNDGQDVPNAGQVSSLTSRNNFINFCLTVPNLPLTDGKQVKTGSCNPIPIGMIPSIDNMPTSKFTFPPNFGVVRAATAFTITMAIRGMQTGNFVNANKNYFAAPQQLNGQGQIIGHSHITVDFLDSIEDTKPTNPQRFAYFKGLNAAANNGILSAVVSEGLRAGAYRLCSINSSSNHQPLIVPVAQHGSLDDCIYFSATDDPTVAVSTN